jgi:hypothetical protein
MYKPLLSTSKAPASDPVTDRLLVPRPSSVIATSATLSRAAVLAFSAIVITLLVSATAVGA